MDNERPRILLAEDDTNLSALLEEYLTLKGYDVTLAHDGEEALEKFKPGQYDLAVLDIMMPKLDGFTLARKIKSMQPEMPIIFLTAKSMKDDKIEGFSIGADDYITKPFSMEEFLARAKAVLRRTKGKSEPEPIKYNFGRFHFDYDRQELRFDNEKAQTLTTKESELLRLLCRNKNRVLTREEALNSIWGSDSYFNARSMDVFITKLRKYLKQDPDVQIVNIHGTGYKLTDLKKSDAE